MCAVRAGLLDVAVAVRVHVRRDGKRWQVSVLGTRVSAFTQLADALDHARVHLSERGGGELVVHYEWGGEPFRELVEPGGGNPV